jgi:hypothetical protein
MLDERFLKVIFSLAFIAGTALISPVNAVIYTLRSVTNSSVEIEFSLDNNEMKNACMQPCVLAFSSSPTLTFKIIARALNAAQPDFSSLPVSVLSKGWTVGSYLQWVSFSPCYSTAQGTREAVEKGRITIDFDAPVISASAEHASIKNGIVHLAIVAGLKKNQQTVPFPPYTSGVKMFLEKDGIYQVRAADLKRLGVPIASIPLARYKIYKDNTEIPLYIINSRQSVLQDDDLILFYGVALRGTNTRYTQYSNTSAYWLTWESLRPGMRITEVSGAQRKDLAVYRQGGYRVATGRDFYDTIHLEEDNDIRWLGSVDVVREMSDTSGFDDLDNWYWGKIGENALTEFKISVPSPAVSKDPSMTARLHIRLCGISSLSNLNPDHRLYLYLNDNPPGGKQQVIEWDGQNVFDFVSPPFPVSQLINGENKITFSRNASGSSQQILGDPDISALNWIEIEYFRTFTAGDDRLVFKNNALDVNGVAQFELHGFSSEELDLWDISDNRLITGYSVAKEKTNNSESYSLLFQDSLTSVHRFFAQTTAQRLLPAAMALDTIRTDWQALAQADYIIVTVDSFFNEFKPFVDAYAKKGITVACADISDVYNAFSSGVQDPESIRSLLRHVFSLSSGKRPRYLLLGGDTTHDLDKNRRDRNLVPTHLSRVPGWGPSSDDGYFACVMGDDNFPDLFVGRFPAQNRKELRNLVTKTVGHLTLQAKGPWHDNILLAGGAESDFTTFNDNTTSEVIDLAMNVYRLDADPRSRFYRDEATAAKDITGIINAGVYAINFNGHGGGNVWSDSRFFSYTDLANLYNGQWDRAGRLPFVFSFTCLTGFFESAFYRSLGEEFVRLEKNGAVGFFGASAYTSKKGNLIMNRLLLDNAVSGSFESVGELLWLVKMNMLVGFGAEYVPLVRQYNYLGDPALPWSIAPDSLQLFPAKSAMLPQDTLSVRGYCAPVHQGQVKVTVGADYQKWSDYSWKVTSDSFAGRCLLKDSLKTARGFVRAFAWNDSQELRGRATFSKSAVLFTAIGLSKSPLRFGDSVLVSADLKVFDSSRTVNAVVCLYSIASRYKREPVFQGISMFRDAMGTWTTNAKIPVLFNGAAGDELLLKFRAVGIGVSDTTEIYAFTVLGRPDLLFAGKGISFSWRGDSLLMQGEVLNAGNMNSPPFSVSFYTGTPASGTLLANLKSTDSLAPGKTRSFSACVPDTQGDFLISALINPFGLFEEISLHNNETSRNVRILFGDLDAVTDTLCSAYNGVCITPAAPLGGKRRVFLFADTIATVKPLRTESFWVPVIGDSAAQQFSIGVRPALTVSDTLVWIYSRFTTDSSEGLKKGAAQNASTPGKLCVLRMDSLYGSWRYISSQGDSAKKSCRMRSVLTGPFALALLNDNKPPQIRVSVNGRELTFLDYAAQGKPFNLFFSDASGIVPSSVQVFLNKKTIDTSLISQIPVQSDLSQVSITAYPKKEYAIDSLSVFAEDFAGNAATADFAYMPGEDLKIKHFSCHPNPFTAKQDNNGNTIQQVRFAFALTDLAQSASIVIYTIASRIVWTWEKTDGVIGYQEVPWNGKTSQGYRIANGTYYAKLRVESGPKKISSVIRIAKLEGY